MARTRHTIPIRTDHEKMNSSPEAFEKFSIWKSLKTPLKVTVIVGGQLECVLSCIIFGVDEEASQVGVSMGRHSAEALDLEDATFSVEASRVVATRNESDWIVFEEGGD